MLSPVYARVYGAGIRSTTQQSPANAGKARQTQAKQADNVNDNEYDTDNDTNNDTDNDTDNESDTETVPASVSGSAAKGFSGV